MLQRLLIEKIEHRIIVGTLAFLGIMVVTGWIAINEGGRMRAFEQQFTARSIERGALLFAANCSTCHGQDGRGLTGVAPALNSPYFFSHNYFAEIDAEVAQLSAERDAEGTSDARRAEIDTRLTELETERASLTASMQTAIDMGYDPTASDYMSKVGWGGGLRTYVYTTLVHGRPKSNNYWPQPMGAWSQIANGPLRSDQLEDLTNYILNYDRGDDWTVEDLVLVRQFPKFPVDPATVVSAGGGVEVIGLPLPPLDEYVSNTLALTGDPVNGQALYTSLACIGCHAGGAVGPATEGSWTRASTVRLEDPGVQALGITTGEAYLIHSVLAPNEYVVPNYAPAMPANFAERLDYQGMADLLAYLRSQDQPQ